MKRIFGDGLSELRDRELEVCIERLPQRPESILEIGGGTGHQARALSQRFGRVSSIDLATSSYRAERVFDIQDYDGVHIPFPDSSFDCVFSSNTLEHIPHLDAFQQEIHRVLTPNGRCLHILPTHTWRLWTSLTHYPSLPKLVAARLKHRQEAKLEGEADQATISRGDSTQLRGGPPSLSDLVRQGLRLARSASFPKRHGERGNVITELGYFHPRYWRWHFEHTGWQVEDDFPVGYLYTGYDLVGRRLSLEARAALAGVLGSSCHAYVLSRSN